MTKKRTTIWIKPEVHRALRIMGAERGLPIGDVIKALIQFRESARKFASVGDLPIQPPQRDAA